MKRRGRQVVGQCVVGVASRVRQSRYSTAASVNTTGVATSSARHVHRKSKLIDAASKVK